MTCARNSPADFVSKPRRAALRSNSAPRRSTPTLSALSETAAHTCLVYESEEEQVRAAAHFISEDLRRGERCAFAGDARTAAHVTAALHGAGVNLCRARERGRCSTR